MRELNLFSGAGGGLLGGYLLGWTPVGYVEINEYCQRVIAQRIEDGILPVAPIFGDIRVFARRWARGYQGLVDVVTAGFPCQPFSLAGKRLGEADPRNMWPWTIRVIRKVRPAWCLLENVPGLLSGSHGYFGQILADLAEAGYDAQWGVFSAAKVGAPHLRKRVWIMAHAEGIGGSLRSAKAEQSRRFAGGGLVPNAHEIDGKAREEWTRRTSWPDLNRRRERSDMAHTQSDIRRTSWDERSETFKGDGATFPNTNQQYDNDPGYGADKIRGKQREKTEIQRGVLSNSSGKQTGFTRQSREHVHVGNTSGKRFQIRKADKAEAETHLSSSFGSGWWDVEPGLDRVANGVANRVDRLRAIGNGQVPAVVREAWEILTGIMEYGV